MIKRGADIWLDGERELFVNLQRRMDGCTKEARKALRSAGLQIIADAKDNLRGNHSVVTGQLRASGKVQKVEQDPDAIDAGFFSRSGGGYAFFVEFGRRAGKMPPIDDIIQWVRKKLRIKDNKVAKGIGFVIAKTIGKRGTRPHPFFGPAVEKNKGAISEAIAEAVNRETKRNG